MNRAQILVSEKCWVDSLTIPTLSLSWSLSNKTYDSLPQCQQECFQNLGLQSIWLFYMFTLLPTLFIQHLMYKNVIIDIPSTKGAIFYGNILPHWETTHLINSIVTCRLSFHFTVMFIQFFYMIIYMIVKATKMPEMLLRVARHQTGVIFFF